MAAFAQRDVKKKLREARLAPAASMPGGLAYRDVDKDRRRTVAAVQVAGNQVLYKRGNVWYSFDVAKQDAEKVAKAKVIERFSPAYFKLIRSSPPAAAQALSRQAANEEMMIEADGEVYRVK
jgi:hypothetical protein